MSIYKRDPKIIRKVLGNKVQFILGDMACVYGGILAGVSFFGGYPITPASEVAEGMARMLPRVGGTYIQMEDEIGSIAAVVGASWGGSKSMTATSGPGFSLMMENYGFAVMTETPCVIVNVQRTGPSTGQPTLGAQGDMMQARYGTHGDLEAIALAPSTVQECLDFTIEAFNLSEKYRTPVCVMTDGEVGHLRERIVIPDEKDLNLIDRVPATIAKSKYIPFTKSQTQKNSKVPDFPTFGTGYKTYVTGLTHNEKGFPATDKQKDHDKLVRRICEKISDDADKLVSVEKQNLDNADTIFVTYGASSRPAETAMFMARKNGKKVGLLRMKTVWPFPEKIISKLAKDVDKIIVPEMNLGQIYHPIKEAACGNCEVVSAPKIGGEMHLPEELLKILGVK
jgi:2-oxoglutarate ferredoxin oxidoreductase subunit alpha